jgi:hypothetical protein
MRAQDRSICKRLLNPGISCLLESKPQSPFRAGEILCLDSPQPADQIAGMIESLAGDLLVVEPVTGDVE